MMASANLYRQRQDTVHALSAFAQASTVAGQEDQRDSTDRARPTGGSRKAARLIKMISLLPEASFAPALEDINVYTLDAKILGVTESDAAAAAAAFVSEISAESHYRIHLGNLPAISGFVGESLTGGKFLFPSVNVVQDRHTYDTFFNGGITPVASFRFELDRVQRWPAIHRAARHDFARLHEPESCSGSFSISRPVRFLIGCR